MTLKKLKNTLFYILVFLCFKHITTVGHIEIAWLGSLALRVQMLKGEYHVAPVYCN